MPIPRSSSKVHPVLGNATQPDRLPHLVAALQSQLGLVQCANVMELRALRPTKTFGSGGAGAPSTPAGLPTGAGAGFVVGRPIRIGNHYDVHPAITIFDPDLGTLAFVEHI